MLRVGDARLQVGLAWDGGRLRETQIVLRGGKVRPIEGNAWSAQVDGAAVTPAGAALQRSDGERGAPCRKAVFHGQGQGLRWQMVYERTGPARVTKSLTLTASADCTLESVAMWDARGGGAPRVAGTSLQDIAAFYRDGDDGLFVSLDFPYSRIVAAEGGVRVTYPPYERLKAGQSTVCHSLTLGATALRGRERYGFDEGEVEAMDAYVQERFPPRFDRPMLTSCCMNNRYTQPEGDWVFYTMKDHPTLSFHTDLFKRDLALMRKLGMEYYQVFPGVFDWVPGDPDPKVVRDLVAYSHGLGMRIGDYSTASGLFCAHYNEHRNHLDRPEWHLVNRDGTPGPFSLGVAAYVDHYIDTVVPNCAKYGFELHNLDFLSIAPDYSAARPYPPGEPSVYQQVRGLVRLLDAIDAVSPQMMTWSNSGNFDQLLPKIAWHNHNLYLTDPFIASPWQGLNMTRLLDESRREQMVSLHYARFLPYRFFTNYQYFFSQNSVVPDIRTYRYGALSTLAVTPNLGLGDIRPWLDTLPQREVDSVVAFYRRWTRLVARHYALWTRTYHVGENPGLGAVEIYGHAKGRTGFVFIVNPQTWSRTVEVPLDASLGFAGQGACEIAELHPVERLRLTAQGPFAQLGSRLPVTVPPQQVLVLAVRPAPARIRAPRLYGLPGTVEPSGTGYLVKTRGPQGTTGRFAVVLPPGASRIGSAAVRPDVPRQPERLRAETPLRALGAAGPGALFEVTFRRRAAPTELRRWSVQPGALQAGLDAKWTEGFSGGQDLDFPLFAGTDAPLPLWDAQADAFGLGPLANFCGAYVENAFSEDQETWIQLSPGGALPAVAALSSGERAAATAPLPPLAKDVGKSWWLATRFHLPFLWWAGGSQPPFPEHTLLVLPLARSGRTSQVRAWMNGAPLEVQAYRYPRNGALRCLYADLVGSSAHAGDNTLVVYYESR